MSHTRRFTGASSALAKRSMRLPSIWSVQSRSTRCTSLLERKAASATVRRARVLSPRVGVVPTRGTSRRWSFSSIVGLISGTWCRRRPSTIRLLLAASQQESLTVYTDGFRVYESLEDDDTFDREYVVHSDGEYVDGAVHVNTCESHGSLLRPWLSPHRGVSKDKLTPYLRAFQLRRELYRKPGRDALKHAIRATL